MIKLFGKGFAALALIAGVFVAVGLLNQTGAVAPTELTVTQREKEFVLSTLALGEFHRTTRAVKDARVIAIADSKTQVMVWRETAEDNSENSFYAVSLDGKNVARIAAANHDLLLRYATFEPTKQIPAMPENLAAKANDGKNAYLVQFVSQSLEEYRREIEKIGGTVYIAVPNQAHIVVMNAADKEKVAALPFVRWVGNYEPAYKIEPELREKLATNSLETGRYNIMILERGAEMHGKIAARIAATGGKVENSIKEGFRLEATLSAAQLIEIARENEILFIDRWSAPEKDMDVVRAVSGANFVQDTLGYTGQGVRAEVLDAGLLTTHNDYQTGGAPLLHGASNVDSHGTATYGINFGRGTTNAAGKGMLPSAQGIFADYDNLTNRYTHTAELKQEPYKAVYQSNSWGNALTTSYTTISAELDDILFKEDFVLLNSQSNNGNQSSRPQAWSKNVVSIGGIRHFNTASFDDDRWQNGASIGPAADGRLKPELAHFYDSVFTTTSTNNTAYTSTFGGTSAATPITAGNFGIFFQMWHNGAFGNATGATVFDSRPHMTTAKAIMINTATQWNMSIAGTDVTRVRQGFGRADLRSLYDLRNNLKIVNETDILTNLQTKSYTVNVAAGSTTPLKVTMIYADPMGNPGAARARINDLNLKVTAPDGTIYHGNVGLGVGGGMWSTSGGVANLVDTVENVFIQTPASGAWTIEVTAAELIQDARTETPGVVDADFALVASGIVNSSVVAPTNTRADFDADGKTDYSVFRNGGWFVQRSTAGFAGVSWGQNGDFILPGDYDGDNKADFAIFRASANPGVTDYYVINSATGTATGASWGDVGDVPQLGDFNGDNRADFAVYRPSNNTWYILPSNGDAPTSVVLGAAGQTPIVLDYDGDAKSDVAMWNASNGVWTIKKSSDGAILSIVWGQTGDKLVAADYDNDNRDDLGIFRNGQWFVLPSNGGAPIIYNFGQSGDVAASGDYDGDGDDDAAVYRNGTWFVRTPSNGFTSYQFGVSGDKPVPAAFFPQ